MSVNFDLLDSSVEELAELDSFEAFPPGTYRLKIGWELKLINNKPTVELKYECLETLELAKVTDEPIEPGKKSSILYYLYKNDGSTNDMGQGFLRKIIEELHKTFGGETSKEVMLNSEGAEIIATLGIKSDEKGDKNTIKSIVVV